MFDNGTEVIAAIGQVIFKGWVQASFVWKGVRHVVVTNEDQIFVIPESKCKHAKPVLVKGE